MADPGVLEALLEVQQLDTTADQLRHRRATLPELQQVAEHDATLATLRQRLEPVIARRHDLERSQRRLEDEVASLEARVTETERALASGAVKAPRELLALQEGTEAVRRHQSDLEDELLEIMEAVEPATADVTRLEMEQERVSAQRAAVDAVVAERQAAIDAEVEGVATARESAAAAVPPDLMATYERLRARLGGVAVARLDGNRCGGCHLTLPATELDAIRRLPPDAVARHEECGRILVRG